MQNIWSEDHAPYAWKAAATRVCLPVSSVSPHVASGIRWGMVMATRPSSLEQVSKMSNTLRVCCCAGGVPRGAPQRVTVAPQPLNDAFMLCRDGEHRNCTDFSCHRVITACAALAAQNAEVLALLCHQKHVALLRLLYDPFRRLWCYRCLLDLEQCWSIKEPENAPSNAIWPAYKPIMTTIYRGRQRKQGEFRTGPVHGLVGSLELNLRCSKHSPPRKTTRHSALLSLVQAVVVRTGKESEHQEPTIRPRVRAHAPEHRIQTTV